MRVVREIPIEPESRLHLDLPNDAKILGVFPDDDGIVLRILADPESDKEYPVIFRLAMTDELINYEALQYVGSVGATHLFVELESDMSVTIHEVDE